MTLTTRQNSFVHAQIFCALRRLVVFFIVTAAMFGGIVITQAQEYQQSQERSGAVHAEPSMMAIQDLTAEELDEVREHGHQHTGNPLQDLLTLGHAHFGCQCASLPVDIFAFAVVPNAAFVVMRMPQREHDSPPAHPFRPPIA